MCTHKLYLSLSRGPTRTLRKTHQFQNASVPLIVQENYSLLVTLFSSITMNLSDLLPIKEGFAWLGKRTVRHVGYISYKDHLEALSNELGALNAQRNDVQRRMEMARGQNMEVRDEVDRWISSVGAMEVGVGELINNATEEHKNTCLGNCCPKNCWSRYNLGKEIDKKLRDIYDLKEKGRFQSVAIHVEEPLDKTMKYLGDDGIGIIGIHGPAGGGKTTLLNQIVNNLLASQQRHIGYVLFIAVPHDLNIDKIQGDIGKEIGFVPDIWKAKSRAERATDVYRVLSHDNYVMLLDDLREPVDLRGIGVPPPHGQNGSKIVFTTVSEEVCYKMGADQKIKVGGLPRLKAWTLFLENVGEETLRSHPEIPKLADAVAEMCDGLALALVTIGRAMNGKRTPREWHNSIEVLLKSIAEFSGNSKVFALLKFAFDNLPNDRVKRCFLYCTLFPQDFSIHRSRITDCWIGEGLLDKPNDEQRSQRKEGYNIINTLLVACLLEEQDNDHVKMHEKIREVALWIACDCGKAQGTYLVEAEAGLTEAPEVRRWEVARRISLMANQIRILTASARCHNLLTLFLGNNDLTTISNSFFQFMPSVRVLDLSRNRSLSELPSGISELSSMECLDLSSTGIRQLPAELMNLVKLKCLNLEHTYQLLTVPLHFILSFPDLIVLRMAHSAFSTRIEGDGIQIGGLESFIRDLYRLEHLGLLSISIKSGFFLQLLEAFDKFPTCTQALSLYSFRHSNILDISFLEGMTMLDELDFIDCTNMDELIFEPSLITRKTGCFNSLRKVSVINCSKLKDLTWLALAPNLESVDVSRCSNMEEIISQRKLGSADYGAFIKLKIVRLVSLTKLKSIHPSALPFPYLKEILVDGCPQLRRLPLNASSASGHRIVIQGWDNWWNNLEWEDENTKLTFTSSFKAWMY